jgi:hypothetical protein
MVRMPVRHAVPPASLFGAHMARRQADPHHRRAQRAEERKRRGSKLLLGLALVTARGTMPLSVTSVRCRIIL